MPRTIREIDKDIRTFLNKYEQARQRNDEVGQKRYSKKIKELHDEMERLVKE